MNLNRVIVFVGRTLPMAAFYATHFDLDGVDEWTEEWAELEAPNGFRLAFHQAYVDGEPSASPTGSPMNPHKLVFTVADVAAARERLVHVGVEMFDVVRFPAGDFTVEVCDGLDPEGHRFQLCNR